MDQALARIVDRELVRDLVVEERRTRDAMEWEAMAACYTPDCIINLSWFKGPAKDFIAGSAKQRAYSIGFHYIWPTIVEFHGDRGLAQTPMEVHIKYPHQGLEIEIISHTQMVSRVVRTEDGWRIASLDVIYRWDEARSMNPDVPLPIRWDEIQHYRWPLRILTWWVNDNYGRTVDDALLGYDRPEQVAAFLDDERAWLTSRDAPVPAAAG